MTRMVWEHFWAPLRLKPWALGLRDEDVAEVVMRTREVRVAEIEVPEVLERIPEGIRGAELGSEMLGSKVGAEDGGSSRA